MLIIIYLTFTTILQNCLVELQKRYFPKVQKEETVKIYLNTVGEDKAYIVEHLLVAVVLHPVQPRSILQRGVER